ncbi:MAG: BMP family ABC transporter substrate-binding protein [Oscillospiraceae bacterium]|nr:BMP family ABC transporter substrate-binding protein [Oscillospiraceae bacterium]
MNHHVESMAYYQQALKAGRKSHRQDVHRGRYPFVQILDEILTDHMVGGEIALGTMEIPTDRIVGTKTRGRTNAFASNFMPLLSESSEFGVKWRALCDAHLSDEGIRDPIVCYEYLGRFYVQEGNKRVSVLKFFDAPTITGTVYRILPADCDSPEVLAYQDFLTYYPQTKLYQIAFSQPGSFPKLQVALGYELDHIWSEEERRFFLSGFVYFERAFQKLGGAVVKATAADALLVWLKIYSFDDLRRLSVHSLEKSLHTIWSDICAIGQEHVIEVTTEANHGEESVFWNRRVLTMMPSYLNIAFIHELLPEDSNWIRAHEMGRMHLEQVMGDQVIVQRFVGVGSGIEAERAMETAIKNGAEIIFATTAPLIAACRRIAARFPNTKILNCSISMPYTDIRTYYSRIYEGKFISGAVAGAISKNDVIGYIASYPIFGVPAGINAFALGAQLTNPNARIELKWACVPGNHLKELVAHDIDIVSTLDIPLPGWSEGQWGTFQVQPDGSTHLITSPYWDWGAFYVQIARDILNGEWETPIFRKKDCHAINYWWGMASGVIGVEWTEAMPMGTRILADFLKHGIVDGSIDPFRRQMVSQDGTVQNDGSSTLSPEKILQMDWLCSNIEGAIPSYEELTEKGQSIVRLQGIYRDQILPQKEGILL